jgi:sulfur carrier protein
MSLVYLLLAYLLLAMIRVNDKFDVEWEPGMTVGRLLEKLKFSYQMLVLSVNGEIIPREEWEARAVADGDQVRALHMLAGG